MIQRLTDEQMDQVVASLPQLDDHSLQHILANVALQLLQRRRCVAASSYVPGQMCVVYAMGRLGDQLQSRWIEDLKPALAAARKE